ncbi:hypothetical protein HK104_011150, partial [Borealophlyctis nickersoniae]
MFGRALNVVTGAVTAPFSKSSSKAAANPPTQPLEEQPLIYDKVFTKECFELVMTNARLYKEFKEFSEEDTGNDRVGEDVGEKHTIYREEK